MDSFSVQAACNGETPTKPHHRHTSAASDTTLSNVRYGRFVAAPDSSTYILSQQTANTNASLAGHQANAQNALNDFGQRYRANS
ncbi:hypothetical protein Cob_v009388 [Colletotrichum orbiculare MAFF 240422]|uniref:Uncharacterized protein n=1 Tax=Colletotrichum orbiculare (strain 104-T / ATCC 96160 / CBS 514.97 / LARS 414 / MAFF 240422) TaxID=1213857 RepID=N4VQ72_COLOR|nr:hypothetical protein Cob_v009388 [Colletotrichum orbiculare MAFF 240422]